MKQQAYTPTGPIEITITTKDEAFIADLDVATTLDQVKAALKRWATR